MTTPALPLRRRSSFLALSVFALALASAAGLVMALRARSGGPVPATPAIVSDVPGQVAELQELHQELQVLRRQVQVMSSQGRAPRTAAAEGGSENAPPPPTQEEVSARDKRRFEGLARKLAAEPVDPGWAPATERLISETVAKPVFKGTKLVSATCHSTMCRFEVRHENDAARSRFSSALPTRLPSLPSGSMRNGEGPERKTIIYVAREGHRIPRDEPQ